ncbi:MAG: flagellar basal body rod protein FlgB [Lachnospiraceae bacterium]|nr:flagellar basal body rod protein FlgB [Lachnospiraceae bacterium]
MINSNVYNYINVLSKAADASWLRNDAISNNIANVDTPNYKRQDVSFETELKHALRSSKYVSLDKKVDALNSNGRLSHVDPRTYLDHSAFSYRLDGNNVDIDTENVELASNQIKYNGLIQSIDQEFKNLKSVIK